jgi:hypothetical protein
VAFARVIADVVKFVADGVRQLMAMIGINLPDTPGVKPGSSVGAATRQASHSGIDDVVKQAQRSAFSLGTASKEDPAAKTANFAGEIAKRADEIYNFIRDLPGKMWEYIQKLPELIWGYMKDLPELIGKVLRVGGELAKQAITNPESSTGSASRGILGATVPGANLVNNAYEFGRDQLKKPGLFGYTSANPF